MLIAMAGLPAAGKSSIAAGVGGALSYPVVSVDPIEAALRRSIGRDQPTGLAAYLVAEAVADGILALGQTVIVDAVNAVEPARRQWRALAARRRVRAEYERWTDRRLVLDSAADLTGNVKRALEFIAGLR
jgi:predicted kinase